MQVRRLGKTDLTVSEIGFGAWAIGASWGPTDDEVSLAAMHAAVDAGVNFFDTADVYGDGHSEKLIGRLLRERSERIVVATKFGRRVMPPAVEYFTYEQMREWLERPRENLGVTTVDLVQLHCPQTPVYYEPAVWEACTRLVEDRLVSHIGVSVEKVEEALKAIEYPIVSTIQIIFNIFRQRPAGLLFEQAKSRGVGIITRVPLASGLLTGKMTRETQFAPDDHRRFNRQGEAFDRGETFAGVDFETGLGVVEELRPLVPDGATLAQFALRWILMHEAVSVAIPGAKTPEQARANAAASDLPPLPEATMQRITELYRERVAPQVHHRW